MVAPRVGKCLREVSTDLTIIGGGLIESAREIEELLAAGINAVTTSNTRLWLISTGTNLKYQHRQAVFIKD